MLLFGLGTTLPIYYIVQCLLQPSLGDTLVEALHNPVTLLFVADVLISTVVFWAYLAETRCWTASFGWLVAVIVLNLSVGLSSALPLFLYVRSRHQRQAQQCP